MSMKKHFVRTALVAAMGLALAGCGSDDSSPATTPNSGPGAGAPSGGNATTPVSFKSAAMAANVADNIITATYREMDTKIAALLTAINALNTGEVTQAKLTAAQNAWREARVPWESSEAFLFGPVDSLGIDPAIDSWPLDTPALAEFLTRNPNATLAQVENASDELRGFHAIEYLLFGDGVDSNVKTAAQLTAPQRAYLTALGQALKNRSQALVDSWTKDFNNQGAYAAQIRNPGASSKYSNEAAVVEELVGGLVTIADEVVNAKLGEPMGTSLANADTSKVESQYSWNSLTDFHNNLQSILNAYTGKLGFKAGTDSVAESGNGLYAFVAAHNKTLADRVMTEIIDAQRKIALIKGDGDGSTTVITAGAKPFREQIRTAEGRALVQTAIDAATKLFETLDKEVKPLVAKTTFTK